MSDTRPPIKLTPNQPVDLYAVTGITVGTQLYVQNNSGSDVRLYAGELEPDIATSGSTLLRSGQAALNHTTDAGAWAWSRNYASVQVSDVVEAV